MATSGMTNFLKNKILNLILNATAYSFPATLYLALYTTEPTAGAAGTEVTGGSYARVALDVSNTTLFPLITTSEGKNASALNFAAASANWGTIVGWGLHSASSGGDYLFYGQFSPSKVINNGDAFSIPINNLVIKLTNKTL